MPAPTSSRTLLAKNLNIHRKRLGVSQVAVSRAAGLGANTVGKIEKRMPNVHLDTVNRLAIALDVDPCLLLAVDSSASGNGSYVERELGVCVAGNTKRLRTSLGLTQEEVALRSGLTRFYVYRVESENVSIALGTLDALACAFGVEAWQLLT
ncbi:helix-turn-helix domain-containing protein [Caballeronia sp. J97]|uniref:helix-turn-helix domain-containing protein n=1 Tax=Caballeronia sp. J97 TaxID=2805429 RepID=UPI0039F143B4